MELQTMKKALSLILIIVVILAISLSLQQNNRNKETIEKKTIVTTIYPIYFMTKSIVGDSVAVERLIKPGNEIHSFSPTPKDMMQIDKSKLFITLGETLEPWVSKLLSATNTEQLALEKHITLLHNHGKEHMHHGDEEHGNRAHHTSVDPHVWLDFANDIRMLTLITQKLTVLYPEQKALFLKNAQSLQKRFEQLQKAYTIQLKECKKDTILVGHDAFGYMEKEYGFRAESIMGIFANSKPNASKIFELSQMIERKGLHFLFIDPIEESKSATQLASDNELEILTLYTLGNISQKDESKGEDMITLLEQNLKNLAKGLECL